MRSKLRSISSIIQFATTLFPRSEERVAQRSVGGVSPLRHANQWSILTQPIITLFPRSEERVAQRSVGGVSPLRHANQSAVLSSLPRNTPPPSLRGHYAIPTYANKTGVTVSEKNPAPSALAVSTQPTNIAQTSPPSLRGHYAIPTYANKTGVTVSEKNPAPSPLAVSTQPTNIAQTSPPSLRGHYAIPTYANKTGVTVSEKKPAVSHVIASPQHTKLLFNNSITPSPELFANWVALNRAIETLSNDFYKGVAPMGQKKAPLAVSTQPTIKKQHPPIAPSGQPLCRQIKQNIFMPRQGLPFAHSIGFYKGIAPMGQKKAPLTTQPTMIGFTTPIATSGQPLCRQDKQNRLSPLAVSTQPTIKKQHPPIAPSGLPICRQNIQNTFMPRQGLPFAYSITLAITFTLAILTFKSTAQTPDLKLWYKQPAQKWTDALPIGNGRLGAMIFGGVDDDRIQFNENTLWTGEPRAYQRNGAVKYLAAIRKLVADGKQPEAEALAQKEFMGMKSHETTYAKDSVRWFNLMRGYHLPKDELFNANDLKSIKLPTEQGWETTPGLEGLDGAVWFLKTFDLPTNWKRKNLVLSLGRIRDIDFTYVNGTQIGTTKGNSYRKYIIPAKELHPGTNKIAIQVINFNDKGGLTSAAKELEIYPSGVDMTPIKMSKETREINIGVDSTTGAIVKPIMLGGFWKYFVQDSEPPAFPKYNADYQPFADIYLQFPKQQVTNYKRDLDITNATAHVTYKADGVTYTREYFSSAPDQVIAIHLTADQPGKVTLRALLKTLHKKFNTRKIDDHTLALSLKVNDGVLKGVSYLHVQAIGGSVKVSANDIDIQGANEAILYLAAATNYKNYHDITGNPEAICKKQITAIAGKSYAAIRAAHIKDYQKYFSTFSIDLGRTSNADLPTDERILKFTKTSDPSFISLYTQYGRYLLISSSRPGNAPANLQGLWNDLLTPPWGSKYTTNINLEMNYWPAEVLNLSACSQPFFSIVDDLSKTGKLTAKEHYGSPGWVLHHNTDLWRGTAPVNSSTHGIWQTGGAWLCHQLWEHYLFTKDKAFLQNRAYPEMKGAAEFFVHTLVKDPKTDYLISTPSNSPEHGGLVAGPTMDHQIIRDLFKNCITAAKVLGIDQQFSKLLQEKYKQIAPNKIGKYGQLQEWMEDKDDTTDTHRHISHLWGVFPGTDITWQTPDLMKAAEKSMKYRGDEGTGWSIAWKVNVWARMKEGDHAYLMFTKLLSPADVSSGKEKGGVYHNLFDAHPPFQIDGNFGGAAGLSEMLLQSQGDAIELLPALPSALPQGTVKGICARGGFVLNFTWSNGQLQDVQVTSKAGGKCKLQYHDKVIALNTKAGAAYHFNGDLKQL